MTYTYLTTDGLVIIESYFRTNQSVAETVHCLNRPRQAVHKVYLFFKREKSALGYYQRYKRDKPNCGRCPLVLPEERSEHIQRKVIQGWAPDVIVGRTAFPINCSAHIIYHMFKKRLFDPSDLPMEGKRKPNGHQERRGKQTFRRSIHKHGEGCDQFLSEFGHLKGNTIVGLKHKSAAITLVERLSKVIITLRPCGRRATDIERRLNQWFEPVPENLFKLITFDYRKESSSWRQISDANDIAIYFADPGTPSQRGLNENSNGLLRRDGLLKSMDFNSVDEFFIQSVVSKRNDIPGKLLDYRTSLKVFLGYVSIDDLPNLIWQSRSINIL